jgi:hypothetical protein
MDEMYSFVLTGSMERAGPFRAGAMVPIAGIEVETASAKAILFCIRKGDLADPFSARDIYRPQWSNLTDRDQIQAGLNLLVELDWLGN